MLDSVSRDEKVKQGIRSLLLYQSKNPDDSTCQYNHHIHTPFALCNEILSNIDFDSFPKYIRILVLFNMEFVYSLSKYVDLREKVVYYYTTDTHKAAAIGILFPQVHIIDNLETDMKFDVVVGNPPYQSQAGTGVQPLWSLFVNKSIGLLNHAGYMAMITPNKWCGHTTNVVKGSIHLYNQKFKGKLLYANIQECSKYFPALGSYPNSFSYFIIANKGSKKFRVTTLEGTYDAFESFEYLPLRCITDITFSILNKVKTAESYDFCQVSTGFFQKNDGSIVISMAQRLHYEKLDIYYDKNSSNKATSKSTVSRKKFNNSSTQKINNIFRSNLFKFIHFIYWNGDNFSTSFYNSLPYLDANQIWDDQGIYQHFNLTQEEIDYIEQNVK